MPNKKTNRICKNCDTIFPCTPRRILCVDCYKKQTNCTNPTEEIKFIDDD